MSKKEIEEGKIFAFLGIFLTILGFIIVLLAKKENKYAEDLRGQPAENSQIC